MKTADDYLNDLDQDLADATKAFREAERLLWRGRRRLVALMGAARALGLRQDEPDRGRRNPGRTFPGKRQGKKKGD